MNDGDHTSGTCHEGLLDCNARTAQPTKARDVNDVRMTFCDAGTDEVAAHAQPGEGARGSERITATDESTRLCPAVQGPHRCRAAGTSAERPSTAYASAIDSSNRSTRIPSAVRVPAATEMRSTAQAAPMEKLWSSTRDIRACSRRGCKTIALEP